MSCGSTIRKTKPTLSDRPLRFELTHPYEKSRLLPEAGTSGRCWQRLFSCSSRCGSRAMKLSLGKANPIRDAFALAFDIAAKAGQSTNVTLSKSDGSKYEFAWTVPTKFQIPLSELTFGRSVWSCLAVDWSIPLATPSQESRPVPKRTKLASRRVM